MTFLSTLSNPKLSQIEGFTMQTKLLLFGYLFVALVLAVNVARALRTETPTLGDVFTPTSVGMFTTQGYRVTDDPALMEAIAAWQFDTGWTREWYVESPLAAVPVKHLRFNTEAAWEDRVYMIVYVDKDDPQIVYPALWSYERMFGQHDDPDLANHPDLNWWSMDRANLDALLDALEG